MCGLFGFVGYNKDNQYKVNVGKVVKSLAESAASRGTHATGIAYVADRKFNIDKSPTSAYKFKVDIPNKVSKVIGHTRFTTQGDAKKNYNNHQFPGRTDAGKAFALAHNGVLHNEDEVRKELKLNSPVIETDSYVAVQVLEHKIKGRPTMEDMKFLGETVTGSFAFTVLDDLNNLWIVKKDNPLSILHFKELDIRVYASTTAILFEAMLNSPLAKHLNKAFTEEGAGSVILTELDDNTIVKIGANGDIETSDFTPKQTYSNLNWYDYVPGKYTSKNKSKKTSNYYDYWEDYDSYATSYSKSYLDGPTEDVPEYDELDMYKEILFQDAESIGISVKKLTNLFEIGYTLTELESLVYDLTVTQFNSFYKKAMKINKEAIVSPK